MNWKKSLSPSLLALFVLSCSPALLSAQATQAPPAVGAAPAAPAQAELTLPKREVINTIAEVRKIVSENGIDSLSGIPINGITQWISVRGHDRRNPILLFLHGGPGSPTMPADYTFQSPWEDYFTVVQWDQRGTGKTYVANDPKAVAPTMTVEQMTSDAEEVVRYLQKTYGKRKIVLLGYSWGTVLGVALAQKHPEWFYAYVGVGQLINTSRNETEGYQFALDRARSTHNAEAMKDLEGIAPYPGAAGSLTFARIGVQRKWLMFYGGLTWGRKDFSYEANAWDLSPDYTEKDLDGVDDGGLFSITHLIGPLEALNLEDTTSFQCPVFLFEGRHDYATSHTIAEEWFRRIHAPEKRFVWFEDSAHTVMLEQPGRFLYHLITDVRPLAAKAGDAAPGEIVE